MRSPNNAESQEASLAEAGSGAESTCPRQAVPPAGHPRPCTGRGGSPQFCCGQECPRLAGVFGRVVFMPMVAPRTPAAGTERGSTVPIQCQTHQEGKGSNLDPKTKKKKTTKKKNPKIITNPKPPKQPLKKQKEVQRWCCWEGNESHAFFLPQERGEMPPSPVQPHGAMMLLLLPSRERLQAGEQTGHPSLAQPPGGPLTWLGHLSSCVCFGVLCWLFPHNKDV